MSWIRARTTAQLNAPLPGGRFSIFALKLLQIDRSSESDSNRQGKRKAKIKRIDHENGKVGKFASKNPTDFLANRNSDAVLRAEAFNTSCVVSANQRFNAIRSSSKRYFGMIRL
jgi:hypothetical protein